MTGRDEDLDVQDGTIAANAAGAMPEGTSTVKLSDRFRGRAADRSEAVSLDLGIRLVKMLAARLETDCGFPLYDDVVTADCQMPMTPSAFSAVIPITDASGSNAAMLHVSQAAARRYLAGLLGGSETDVSAPRPHGPALISQADRMAIRRIAETFVAALNDINATGGQTFQLAANCSDDLSSADVIGRPISVALKNRMSMSEYCELRLELAETALAGFGLGSHHGAYASGNDASARMVRHVARIPVRISCRIAEGDIPLHQMNGIKAGDTFAIDRLPVAQLFVDGVAIGTAIPGKQSGRRAICAEAALYPSGDISR